MNNLTPWDAADDFTPGEAACLVAGVNPSLEPESPLAAPILARMKSDHDRARGVVASCIMLFAHRVPTKEEVRAWMKREQYPELLFSNRLLRAPLDQRQEWLFAPYSLASPIDLDALLKSAGKQDAVHVQVEFSTPAAQLVRRHQEVPYELPNKLAGAYGAFENQQFGREELHRWLRLHKIGTRYNFIRDGEHKEAAAILPERTREPGPLTEEEKAAIIQMVERGERQTAIAKKFGKTHTTIGNVLKDAKKQKSSPFAGLGDRHRRR